MVNCRRQLFGMDCRARFDNLIKNGLNLNHNFDIRNDKCYMKSNNQNNHEAGAHLTKEMSISLFPDENFPQLHLRATIF